MFFELFRLARPRQWLKNMFVFAPLFFSFRFVDAEAFASTVLAFLSFSFVASSIYGLNDIHDLETDKEHPLKKKRPIASGRLSVRSAALSSIFFASSGFFLALGLGVNSLLLLLAYAVMNVLYCVRLKHVPVVDIFCIAVGFVIRVQYGGMAADIEVSRWIIVMTFLLAVFLALAKRRDDVLLSINGTAVRKAIDGYNLKFIESAMSISASVTLVAYLMYSMSSEVIERMGTQYIYVTSLFVFAGVMRYLQISFVENASGSPIEALLKDLFLQITLLLWLASFVVLHYVPLCFL